MAGEMRGREAWADVWRLLRVRRRIFLDIFDIICDSLQEALTGDEFNKGAAYLMKLAVTIERNRILCVVWVKAYLNFRRKRRYV